MGAPSSMWPTSRPPRANTLDDLNTEEREAVMKIRRKREAAERKALRTRERADRLEDLRKEVAALEAEERRERRR